MAEIQYFFAFTAPPVHCYCRHLPACYGQGVAQTYMGNRRWLGVIALAGALGMLVAGQTVLQGRLRDLAFLVYWLTCFALTGLAIVIAFLDAWVLRRRTRQEARDLLQSTLDKIETDRRQSRKSETRNPKSETN